MKKNVLFGAVVLLVSMLSFSSCDPTEGPTPEPIEKDSIPQGNDSISVEKDYSMGNFVVCEGNFNSNDGEISYINDTILIEDLFQSENNRLLGDIVQSFTVIGEKGYIVVNNSQKVEVVNAKTFKSIGTIKGLSFPRHIASVDGDNILITNGNGYGDNYVYEIDGTTYEKIDSVATGAGPEKILISDNKIYISNLGQYTNDKTITVLNASTLEVLKTVEVGDLPVDMALDTDGYLWILCKGLTEYDPVTYDPTIISNSKIVKMNISTYAVETVVDMDHQIGTFSSNVLTENNNDIYYLDDAIYKITKDNTTPTKVVEGFFYSIDIDPATGYIWAANTNDVSSHKVEVYLTSGAKLTEYKTAKFPNAVIFQ